MVKILVTLAGLALIVSVNLYFFGARRPASRRMGSGRGEDDR